MTPTASLISRLLLYLALGLAASLMLRMVVDYSAFRDDVHFLRFKQGYVGLWWWKTAFYIHVFSSLATLCAGFTQFSQSFLRDHRPLHRLIGRNYAYDILLINVPTGMVLALCANGRLPGRIAFVLLDCLWFAFTLIAVTAARRGDIARHRRFMIRSYALTFSAITLRTWKLILSTAFNIEPAHLYMIEAWLGFVPNLIFAEAWIRARIPHHRAAQAPPIPHKPELAQKDRHHHTNHHEARGKTNSPRGPELNAPGPAHTPRDPTRDHVRGKPDHHQPNR